MGNSNSSEKNSCSNACNDFHVPFRFQIRILSVFVVIAGLMQLVLGLNIYTTVTKPVYGIGWYSGFALLVTGIIGVFVKNRGTSIATWVFSLISIVISLFSTGVDCINSNTLLTLQACAQTTNLYNPDIYVYTGNSDFEINAAVCMTSNYDNVAKGSGCYCSTAKNYCYPFFGVSNCNTILQQVTDRLSVLCFLDTSSTCVVFSLSLLLFTSLFIHPKQVNESDKDAIKRTQLMLRQKVIDEQVKTIELQNKLELKTNANNRTPGTTPTTTSGNASVYNDSTDRESIIDFSANPFGGMNPLAGGTNPLAGGDNPLAGGDV